MPVLRFFFAHPVVREGQGLEAAQAVAVAGVSAELVLEGQASRVRVAAEVGDGVEAVVGHVHVRTVRGDAQPVQARETADRLNEEDGLESRLRGVHVWFSKGGGGILSGTDLVVVSKGGGILSTDMVVLRKGGTCYYVVSIWLYVDIAPVLLVWLGRKKQRLLLVRRSTSSTRRARSLDTYNVP